MTVYIDELLLVNFITDYLLLRLAGHFSRKRLCRWRVALGAAAGAVYAAVCALTRAEWPVWLPVKLAVGVGMCAVGFGPGRGFMRTVGWFFLFSAALGGGVWALSVFSGGRLGYLRGAVYFTLPAWKLLILAGALWGLFELLARLPGAKTAGGAVYRKAELFCGGGRAEVKVLVDSGCFLRGVMLLSREVACALLSPGAAEAVRGGAGAEELVLRFGGSLVSASGVGDGGVLLYAFRGEVRFEGKKPVPVTFALSPGLDREGLEAVIGKFEL